MGCRFRGNDEFFGNKSIVSDCRLASILQGLFQKADQVFWYWLVQNRAVGAFQFVLEPGVENLIAPARLTCRRPGGARVARALASRVLLLFQNSSAQ